MNKKIHKISFILPGLFEGLLRWSENKSDMDIAPALLWFFSKSSKKWRPVQGFEQTLLDSFYADVNLDEELPIALLRAQTDSKVICADPVSLQLGVSESSLSYGAELQLTENDITQLSDYLNVFFAMENLRFSLDSDGYGLLYLDGQPDLSTTTLSAATGSIYRDMLPAGKDQLRWHRLGNEIQMHLHDCEFNHRRESEGKLPVNTLWFWGAGKSRPVIQNNFNQVFASDGLSKTLTSHLHKATFDSPENLQSVFNQYSGGHTLVVLDGLWPFSQKDDYLGWCQQLSRYENDWFQPLKAGFSKHHISQLQFRTTTGEEFNYQSINRLRVWRKLSSFHDYLTQ